MVDVTCPIQTPEVASVADLCKVIASGWVEGTERAAHSAAVWSSHPPAVPSCWDRCSSPSGLSCPCPSAAVTAETALQTECVPTPV
jgi:hypothetical protein